jgi:hypothetical protein
MYKIIRKLDKGEKIKYWGEDVVAGDDCGERIFEINQIGSGEPFLSEKDIDEMEDGPEKEDIIKQIEEK